MIGDILILDDNISLREGLTDILNTITENIFTASNGQDVLEILRQQRQNISLILLDRNMPVMNGEQTYARLQEIATDVKVIVSTRLSQAEFKSRIGDLELPNYLQKPIDVDMLLNIVQSELTNRVSPGTIS